MAQDGNAHGKAPELTRAQSDAIDAGLAGACCFDCGVESQQVGLSGDSADEFNDVANLLCSIRKRCDLAVVPCASVTAIRTISVVLAS